MWLLIVGLSPAKALASAGLDHSSVRLLNVDLPPAKASAKSPVVSLPGLMRWRTTCSNLRSNGFGVAGFVPVGPTAERPVDVEAFGVYRHLLRCGFTARLVHRHATQWLWKSLACACCVRIG